MKKRKSLRSQRYPVVVYPPLLLKLKVKSPRLGADVTWQSIAIKDTAIPENTFIYFLPLSGVMAIAICLRVFGGLWIVWAIALLGLAIASYYFRLPFKVTRVQKIVNLPEARPQSIYQRLQGKVLAPSGTSNAPSGSSEARFKTYLERYFPVRQNLKFDIPKTELSYTPDFLIEDETGIVIDVEIDEPYEYKSKKPHHCVDAKEDHLRDAFFREGNIITIRFAEEQVVREPLSCCKYVAAVLDNVKGSRYLDKFEGVPDVKLISRWTAAEAIAMAKSAYRDRYRLLKKK